MATESMQVNGNANYAPHHGYGGIDQQHFANNVYTQQAPPAANTPATTASTQSEIPKDEVGWYFVEQYYTTLSRTPDKLYLYYNKRSQYVSGNETDKVQVCVGQRAINDRIKELDFHECKVRITNVDSQASDANIIIQVIGEISNKSQPHRKFTQTFVLATQTNGYFVLNDIFRYIIEEEDEPQAEPAAQNERVQQQPAAAVSGYQEPAPTAEDTEPKTLTSSLDPAAVEKDAQAVDKELTSQVPEAQQEPVQAPAPAVNGAKSEEALAPQAEEETPAAAPVEEPTAPLESTESQVQPEKPKDPEPTPAASPPKQAPAQPAAPPKPAVPKTWASLAAAASKPAAAATPAPQQAQQAPAQQQQQAKPAMPTKPSAAPSAPAAQAAPAAAQRDASPATTSGDEWTAVGANHNRTQSRAAAPELQQQAGRGYIRNVGENIKGPELKEKLSQFGELTHFDVNRQRNCAFIEFATPSGFTAAVAANPLVLGNDRLYVEERRQQPRTGQFPPRGGMQGRGGQRGGPGRGAFGGAGRGRGGGAPRGRGGAQAA